MKNSALRSNKTNLATLCLNLYDDIKKNYSGSCTIKPMPRDEAFEKELDIKGGGAYCALCTAICELLESFHKDNDEIILSTYQSGIMIQGLKVSSNDLSDLCMIESGKYLIQDNKLGLALAFLKMEQVEIEPFHEKNRDSVGFAFLNTTGC